MDKNIVIDVVTGPSIHVPEGTAIMYVGESRGAFDEFLDLLVDHWPHKFTLYWVDDPKQNYWGLLMAPHMDHIVLNLDMPDRTRDLKCYMAADPKAIGVSRTHNEKLPDMLSTYMGQRFVTTIPAAVEAILAR